MGRKRGRAAWVGIIVLAVGFGCPGWAEARPSDAGEDLAVALDTLARRANVELIFDAAQLAGIRVVPVAGLSPRATLDELLAGTRFTSRQADPHTFVVVARVLAAAQEPQQPPPSAGPEIVVTGRLSQNVDLVRGRDEIQPYWVATGQDIDTSGATSADDFLRTQLPMNRDLAPLSQSGASPRSEIDLRGLGSAQTLVLIDGRRMADVPVSLGLFGQADVNAIPVEAIDRIEVLSTAAGGIFGIGATGGAVNIVLRHDDDGLLLSAGNGMSEQGDGIEHRLYGRFGWRSHDGRTKITVSGSYVEDGGLLAGQRPFAQDARQQRVNTVGYGDQVVSNALNIQSASGAPLVFDAAYGGASLGSSLTYLSLGTVLPSAAGVAALVANAGKQDIALSSDAQGGGASLVARTRRSSVMATVRQDVGDSSELFLDYMRFDDRGYEQVSSLDTNGVFIAAGAAGNPFAQSIYVTFPSDAPATVRPEYDLSQRLSAGLIRRFAGGWSLESDIAYSTASLSQGDSSGLLLSTPEVFSGAAALAATVSTPSAITDSERSIDRLIDGNLRVVGPLARLPGGTATITATAEFRREWSPGALETVIYEEPGFSGVYASLETPEAENVWSLFGEARLPLLPATGPARPWRGLAAQLALRLDHYLLDEDPAELEPIRNHASVLAITAGLQARPINGLMLRTSFATAAMPPTAVQLQAFTSQDLAYGFSDPDRGGAQIGQSPAFQLDYGNTRLKPQQTDTFSAGLVLEPPAMPGLRLSIDYTLLATRHQIVELELGDIQYFLDNEALYPGRVQRAALTAADIAAGYTAGAITEIDVGPLQTGRSSLQTLDITLAEDLRAGAGRVHLSADADWVLSDRQYADPTTGTYNLVGHADGPIAWRINLGVDWSDAHWSIGAQGQLYAGYSLADGSPLYDTQIEEFAEYGLSVAQVEGERAREPQVPVQDYFNLSVAFRPQGARGMQIRLTIDNLFDKQPPVVANALLKAITADIDQTPPSGVANYGDVLGRRFALNLRVPFGR